MKLLASANNGGNPNPGTDSQSPETYEDFDSTCSIPYVSAPSSPDRGSGGGGCGYFYSAPASPMHPAIASFSSSMAATSRTSLPDDSVPLGFEFEFSARFGDSVSGGTGSMISADELFLNGQIRPMKLSTHLERPQAPAPSLHPEQGGAKRGRDLRLRDKSMRQRTRSFSPMRNMPDFELISLEDPNGCSEKESSKKIDERSEEIGSYGSETSGSGSSSSSTSRSSSAGRSSKRWIFLKDFLRSKSEGRSNNKLWSNISFHASSTSKVKKQDPSSPSPSPLTSENHKGSKKSVHKLSFKRSVPPSAHELHYTANREQAEELRKRTFLPYRQGLLGCLGLNSKGYDALSSFMLSGKIIHG